MKPTKKVLNGHAQVKVAIVQTAPVFLDRDRTIDKACLKIAEAASQGAQIIVFSEAWIAGYPYWGEGWESRLEDWADVRAKFFDNALIINDEECAQLCAAAARANAVVVIGCNEMDAHPAIHTTYNSLLYIDNHGQILGRHRKIMPTFAERTIWGRGDGSDLLCLETDYGRISGLICGENLMTLARAHLISQGEDFHVSVFPGAFTLHTGPKLEEFDAEARSFWGYASCSNHASESGAFVLGSCGYITQNDFPDDFALRDSLNIDYAQGGSAIFAPVGVPVTPPTPGDTIVYAVCEARFIKVAKAVIDTVGHYSRSDIFTLNVHPRLSPGSNLWSKRALESISPGELNRIADRHEVSVAAIEEAVVADS
ncbi:carbon-nitrogen hydrolase family protein [Pseudomonas sp. 25 R 14]|uniref:carbon-nitrogen hydrolase family protein n=1 Tax=Pseudomonas sp. 25 R 14 TaxID=1844109 RepID=UPI000812B61C|nr:carbon-nitrogen hydrolase family protein [Pseudomonas sp. 25 R 14]CRM80504.1 Aliphatic nitrilase [Pseudomonas sp. 25 R 14]